MTSKFAQKRLINTVPRIIFKEQCFTENTTLKIFTVLDTLKSLEFINCCLRRIPPEISHFNTLKILSFEYCKIEDPASLDIISSFRSLEELTLRSCNLNALPSSFTRLENLTMLNLDMNKFYEGLPECIGAFTNLKRLYLHLCNLGMLPDSMTKLTNLEKLSLACNKFGEVLPEVVYNLTTLTNLDLAGCGLHTLPFQMTNLINLKELSLGMNCFIEGLPNVIYTLTALEKLTLINCGLREFPQKLRQLPHLKWEDTHWDKRIRGPIDEPVVADMRQRRNAALERRKKQTRKR